MKCTFYVQFKQKGYGRMAATTVTNKRPAMPRGGQVMVRFVVDFDPEILREPVVEVHIPASHATVTAESIEPEGSDDGA